MGDFPLPFSSSGRCLPDPSRSPSAKKTRPEKGVAEAAWPGAIFCTDLRAPSGPSLQNEFRLVCFFLGVAVELPQIEVSLAALFRCFSHHAKNGFAWNEPDRRGLGWNPRSI